MTKINIDNLTTQNFLDTFKDITEDYLLQYSKSELQLIYNKITNNASKLKGSKQDYVICINGYIKATRTAIAFKNLK